MFRLQIAYAGNEKSLHVDLRRLEVDLVTGRQTYTHLIDSPWMFQVDRMLTTPVYQLQTNLLLNDITGEPIRTLRVIRHSDGGPTRRQEFSAESFHALRTTHAEPFAEYAEPMLAEMGLLLGLDRPTPAAAWQVLAPYAEPDPATADRVLRLLRDLDADAFDVRRQAADALAAALADAGRDAAVVLMRQDPASLSAEQASALDALLAEHRPLPPAEAQALADDPDFLARVLLIDDDALRRLAKARLERLIGRPFLFAPGPDAARQVENLRRQFAEDRAGGNGTAEPHPTADPLAPEASPRR